MAVVFIYSREFQTESLRVSWLGTTFITLTFERFRSSICVAMRRNRVEISVPASSPSWILSAFWVEEQILDCGSSMFWPCWSGKVKHVYSFAGARQLITLGEMSSRAV
jgi:hypothetical protein